MYTVAEIIDIARVSQYLVTVEQTRRGLWSGGTDPRWARMLYVERQGVEWMYALDPEDPNLIKSAYYLYALCGRYAQVALDKMAAAGVAPGGGATGGSGTVVSPTPGSYTVDFEYLIEVAGSQFTSPTTYNDARIAGKDLVIYWNEVNRYIEAGAEWQYTDTGIEILIEGFDAATSHADAHFKIYIQNPDLVFTPSDSSGGGTTGFTYTFPLTLS
jgi:hypothetical protein